MTVAIATALATLPLWLDPPPHGPDEGYMRQAVMRASRGQGLTSIMHDEGADLAVPDYRHLTHWPPLWCVLAWGLVGAGMAPAWVPATLSGIATAVGMVGWLRVAALVLRPRGTWGATVAWWVFAVGLATIWAPWYLGPCDAPFWAVMGWWVFAHLRATHTGRWQADLAVGLWAAVAVGFRYPAVYLIPAGALCAVGLRPLHDAARSLRSRAITAVGRVGLVAGPPVITLAAILAVNAAMTGQAVRADARLWSWRVQDLRLSEPARLLFAQGFATEATVLRVRPSWRREPLRVWPWLFGAMTAAALAAVMARSQPRAGVSGGQPRWPMSHDQPGQLPCERAEPTCEPAPLWPTLWPLAGIMAVGIAGQWAFLSTFTVILPVGDIIPLDYPRYFRELLPGTALLWTALLIPTAVQAVVCAAQRERPARPTRWLAGVVVVVTAGLLLGLAVYAGRVLYAHGLLIERVARHGPTPPRTLDRCVVDLLQAAGPAALAAHRILDSTDGTPERFIADDAWTATRLPDHRVWQTRRQGHWCSAPVFLVIITRPVVGHEITPNGRRSTGHDMVARLGLPLAATVWDAGEPCRVYAGWVAPEVGYVAGGPPRESAEIMAGDGG